MTDFPAIIAALNGFSPWVHRSQDPDGSKAVAYRAKRVCKFNIGAELLEKAVATGNVTNAQLTEIKDYLSRALEDATRSIEEANRAEYGELSNIVSMPQMHAISGRIKKLQKNTSEHPLREAALTLFLEFETLSHKLASLKDKVVVRQPKPVEDRTQPYVAPAASSEATKLVLEALREVTDANFKALVAHLAVRLRLSFQHFLNARVTMVGKSDTAILYAVYGSDGTHRSLMGMSSASEILDAATNGKSYEAAILEMATTKAKMIQHMFLAKNVTKLDSILDKKGNFTSIEIVGSSLDLHGMRGTFLLKFDDGASFCVQNEIVWSHSIHNKEFPRFPLTFHNVKLAGGVVMKSPSEERMNTVFVGLEG